MNDFSFASLTAFLNAQQQEETPYFVIMSLVLCFSLLVLISSVTSNEAFRSIFPIRLLDKTALKTKESNKMTDSIKDSMQWWEDLAPPFRAEYKDAHHQERKEIPHADVLHFCFLVHGHRGFSKDLSYMQTVMRVAAKEHPTERWVTMADSSKSSKENENINMYRDEQQLRHDMVVHSAVCNERKTTDGVAAGGERLVEEMLQVIREEMAVRPLTQNITISVLGNSLGGIYGRYAVAKLAERCEYVENDDQYWLLDGKYRLHFNVFCTTATPHLGVAGHTYLPLPRTAEIGVAHAMGDTGKDLFRLNDLMKKMGTSPEFLEPLGSFKKRVAYANAYGTDFPVPANTAAFLSESSSYPHHFVEDNDEDDRVVVDDNGLVIATLHTPPLCNRTMSHNDTDELAHMSSSLDSLGWKKVFVDIRREIPKMKIPKIRRSNNSSLNGNSSGSDEEEKVEIERRDQAIHRLKRKGVVKSKDVAAAVTTPIFEDTFHWPMGHNMMVAFSRSRLSTYLNKGGRPVVDSLAKELVEDIFSWKPEDAKREQE